STTPSTWPSPRRSASSPTSWASCGTTSATSSPPTMKGGYPDAGMQTPHQSLPRQGPGPGGRVLLPSPGGDRGPAGGERSGKDHPPEVPAGAAPVPGGGHPGRPSPGPGGFGKAL